MKFYDHDGIRVAKTVDGVRINFTVDKNRPYAQVIEERDDGGALLASYIHGVDLISQHRDGHDYYYHTDEQGSVLALSDENGAKAAQYYYTSYGELWNQGHSFADTNKYRYTGEQFDDETGFYYLRARYYDPGVGRFVTQDNCSGGLGCIDTRRPISLNKYLYANANPMLYADPSGHFGLVGAMVSVATVGILSMVSLPAFGRGGGDGGVGDTENTEASKEKSEFQIHCTEGFCVVGTKIDDWFGQVLASLGINHVDITYNARVIFVGMGGDKVRMGKKYTSSNNVYPLTKRGNGSLSNGDKAGAPCANSDDPAILSCLTNVPQLENSNCQGDAANATRKCCLTGFSTFVSEYFGDW